MMYECGMRTIESAEGEWLTTREVADLCRVHTATVLRWRSEGRLAGVQISPRVFRFRRSDVEALMSGDQPNGDPVSAVS